MIRTRQEVDLEVVLSLDRLADILVPVVVASQADRGVEKIWVGKDVEDRLAQRVDPVGRNLVARKAGIPGAGEHVAGSTRNRGIPDVDLPAAPVNRLREVPYAFEGRRHRAERHISRFVGLPVLAGQEEEPLVPGAAGTAYRPTERATAGLVAEYRLREVVQLVEIVVRRQVLVPHVEGVAATELVRPRLRDDADRRAGIATVFGLVSGGVDLDLLDGVDAYRAHLDVRIGVIGGHAVEGNGDSARGEAVDVRHGRAVRAAQGGRAISGDGDAWQPANEVHRVAAPGDERIDLLGLKGRGDRRGARLDYR